MALSLNYVEYAIPEVGVTEKLPFEGLKGTVIIFKPFHITVPWEI